MEAADLRLMPRVSCLMSHVANKFQDQPYLTLTDKCLPVVGGTLQQYSSIYRVVGIFQDRRGSF